MDFLDHLRVALTVLVVLHHLAVIYGANASFYYVEPPYNDPLAFVVLTALVLIDQAFFMGPFFLISGYFTPASYDHKNTVQFLQDRLVRLGIPLCIFVLVLNPIASIGIYQMPADWTGVSAPFTWQQYPRLFGVGPLWFVEMLLLFDIGYAVWRRLAAPRRFVSQEPLPPPGARAIAAFTVALGAVTFGWRIAVPLGLTLPIAGFPTLAYLPQYLTFFVIGMAASRHQWFASLHGRAGKPAIATADGKLLCADAETHPDLFWAIRGGGGNFGVATRFKFRLHKVDAIVGGMLVLPATPDTIAAFVGEAQAAPEELSTIASVMVAPPMPFLPAETHGQLVILATMVYAGDVKAGERAIAPFRTIARPIADMVGPMRYPELYTPDEGRHPAVSTRTMFLDAIDRSAAQTMVEHLRASTAQLAAAEIRVLGGAMACVSTEATAFAHRRSRILLNVAAIDGRPDEAVAHEPWVRDFAAALRQGDEGAYVGFLGAEDRTRVRAAYPGATWERLAAVKKRYDPTNLFRVNHNITPS
jgi:hypothetical protein